MNPDEPHVPKLRLTVENADGEVVYSTWQECANTWRNAFLVFDDPVPDVLGQTIGNSMWDVPDPIELQRAIEQLDSILKPTAEVKKAYPEARALIDEVLGR